jgi:hypothetical protein
MKVKVDLALCRTTEFEDSVWGELENRCVYTVSLPYLWVPHPLIQSTTLKILRGKNSRKFQKVKLELAMYRFLCCIYANELMCRHVTVWEVVKRQGRIARGRCKHHVLLHRD